MANHRPSNQPSLEVRFCINLIFAWLFLSWSVLFCLVLQGRQKLALFNAREFATLIIDILNDARRREQDSNPDLTQGIKMGFMTWFMYSVCSPLNFFSQIPELFLIIPWLIGWLPGCLLACLPASLISTHSLTDQLIVIWWWLIRNEDYFKSLNLLLFVIFSIYFTRFCWITHFSNWGRWLWSWIRWSTIRWGRGKSRQKFNTRGKNSDIVVLSSV